jgi:hypothetical protein
MTRIVMIVTAAAVVAAVISWLVVRHLAVALGRVIGEIEREFPHGY